MRKFWVCQNRHERQGERLCMCLSLLRPIVYLPFANGLSGELKECSDTLSRRPCQWKRRVVGCRCYELYFISSRQWDSQGLEGHLSSLPVWTLSHNKDTCYTSVYRADAYWRSFPQKSSLVSDYRTTRARSNARSALCKIVWSMSRTASPTFSQIPSEQFFRAETMFGLVQRKAWNVGKESGIFVTRPYTSLNGNIRVNYLGTFKYKGVSNTPIPLEDLMQHIGTVGENTTR